MFTEFIRQLIGGAEQLDGEVFAALWENLRIVLRAELRRRGLWSAPPSYLGIYGWSAWQQVDERRDAPQGGGSGGRWRGAARGDALEELAAGCYAFIFVDRLRSLAAQLLLKPDVEGLVLLDIRHFLHELQRRHDPLGYRVFAVARSAVLQSLTRGELAIAGGDPRVRNDTLLIFAVPGDATSPPSETDFTALVRRWNDRLLPDLVTAAGRAQEEVAGRLSHCLTDLWRHGIQRFRFKELIDPLKSDVRSRWAELLNHAGGSTGAPLAGGESAGGRVISLTAARPDLDLEARDGFAVLARGVAAAIDRLSADGRTRDYLARLWQFLSVRALSEDEGGNASATVGAVLGELGAVGESPVASRPSAATAAAAGEAAARPDAAASDERSLSHRRLAGLLGIPRERLPELYHTLADLTRQVRARDTGGGGAAVDAPPIPLSEVAAPTGTVPAGRPLARPEAVRRR